ncbi:MAG: hypothetical protein JW940_39675 [Polyangiaceae bacterium]|nr:hypothetical protein [Polyangiaceae bacterium]
MHNARDGSRGRRVVAGFVLLVASGVAACASSDSVRIVETPAGSVVTYGAPKDRVYAAEAASERDVLRLRIRERSVCDKIPVQMVERVEETLDDGDVVSRRNLGKRQVAGDPTETVPCDETLTRDAEVSLRLGNETFLLGTTDRDGLVVLDVSDRLRLSLYGENAPVEASVEVRGPRDVANVPAGRIALASLITHEARVNQLLAEIGLLLDKPEPRTGQDIRRSYELYAQLRQLAPKDARFLGMAARFWELFYSRKQREATENLARNLRALDKARELLKATGIAAIPVFAQAAINSGGVDAESLEWAEWQLLGGLRQHPVACQGRFSWRASLGYGFDPATRIALDYLRFAYGDGYASRAQSMCRRLPF